MAHKISVYLDDPTHRELKAAASHQGVSLSDFMARSAKEALRRPQRREAAQVMDRLTRSTTADEIREMRDRGRP